MALYSIYLEIGIIIMYLSIVILFYYYADNADIGTYNNNNVLTTSEPIICVHNVICQSDTGTF